MSRHMPTLTEQSNKILEDVRELKSIALSTAGDAIGGVRERGTAVLGRRRDDFDHYVAENPLRAILVAAGIAALIGYCMRGR